MNTNPKPTPTSDTSAPTQTSSAFVIGVRLRGADKSERCDPGTLTLRVGQQVMVETPDGPRYGVIASNKIVNFNRAQTTPSQRILRLATAQDIAHEEALQNRERHATQLCRDFIDKLNLPMNLTRVVYYEELKKSVFFFTAEGRIDFRELVKELAARLKHRIEMRQVGVRDEARAITGYGMCGEELCCSRFLQQFTPVTIRMAKDQGLALNPNKISGVCGRLMCCLQYEHSLYKSLIKELPKVGKTIQTPDGSGKVIKNDILKQIITVRLDDESVMYYHLDDLRATLGKKPETPDRPNQQRSS